MSAYSWKIMPMRRRARRKPLRPRRVMSVSLTSTRPLLGFTSRLMQRISVDLPLPEGPISPTTWPAGTSKETPRSA